MECTDVRLVLKFLRTRELDAAEQKALENHLGGCPDCDAIAQAENRLDDALETAMPRVPIPTGLKDRILQQLGARRRPRPWRAAAAAAVLLVCGCVAYFAWMTGPEELDPSGVGIEVDFRAGLSREAVEAKFTSELGIFMKAPREFNFNLLDSYDTAAIQGRRVPKLTFLSRGETGAALAHVYVLSTEQFKLPPRLEDETAKQDGWLNELIPASTHNIRLRRYQDITDFFYVIVYTSGSLDPFVFQGI